MSEVPLFGLLFAAGSKEVAKPVSKAKPAEVIPPGFERFWQAWPTHFRKKDRKYCLKIWFRDGLEDKIEQIIKAVGYYKLSNQWTDKSRGDFQPGPGPWLNDESYLVPMSAFPELANRAKPLPRGNTMNPG